jgi:AbrB family looped-hinge helix DNA binding protein
MGADLYYYTWRTKQMRITTKGQVTIPRDVREKMGLLPHSEVEFVVEGNVVMIRKVEGKENRGRKIVERMRGRATVRMSTDEIMALTRGDE